MDIKSGLEKYCYSDRSLKIYQTVLSTKNYTKAAKILSVNESTVRKCINKILFNSQNIYSLEENLNKKSTSTLYDKSGNIVSQWVKEDVNKPILSNIFKEYIKEYSNKIPKYIPPKKQVSNFFEEKLVVYPIADLHLGMLSWIEETGNEYNTEIADELIRKSVQSIIDKSPACEECLICVLGDFLHVDNALNKTERSGNILDCDSRYGKIMQISIKLMRYIIEYALNKHHNVKVICCKGNHDDLGEMWLSAALTNIYEKEKRLEIISNFSSRIYYRYGNTLIGCTHGSDAKDTQLPIIMATEKKEDWGSTKFHYWYCGHWHQNKVTEVCDCVVEAFNAVCAKDAWSNSKGYLSNRCLKALFIDPVKGETERYTLNI